MTENIYFSFFCSYRPSHEVVIIRQENFTFLYGVYDTITQPRVHNNCSRCTKITVNPYSWCACAAFVKVVIQTKPARTQPIFWWKCAHKASFAHVCKDSSNSRWYYKKVQGLNVTASYTCDLWYPVFWTTKFHLNSKGLGQLVCGWLAQQPSAYTSRLPFTIVTASRDKYTQLIHSLMILLETVWSSKVWKEIAQDDSSIAFSYCSCCQRSWFSWWYFSWTKENN